jgi:hypothetical protein
MKTDLHRATQEFLTHQLGSKTLPQECNLPEETVEERLDKLQALLKYVVAEMIQESSKLRSKLEQL